MAQKLKSHPQSTKENRPNNEVPNQTPRQAREHIPPPVFAARPPSAAPPSLTTIRHDALLQAKGRPETTDTTTTKNKCRRYKAQTIEKLTTTKTRDAYIHKATHKSRSRLPSPVKSSALQRTVTLPGAGIEMVSRQSPTFQSGPSSPQLLLTTCAKDRLSSAGSKRFARVRFASGVGTEGSVPSAGTKDGSRGES